MKKKNNKSNKKTNNKKYNKKSKSKSSNQKNRNRNNIKFNKSKNKDNRKELLAKNRRNDSTRMPNDLSFCFVGKLAKKNKGFGFVEPIDQEEVKVLSKKFKVKLNNFNEDIYIAKELALGANNDDIVLVRIVDQKKLYEGKVIKILERNQNDITGIYESSNNFGFVKPTDKSYSTDIYIRKEDSMNAKSGDAVIVEIIKYPIGDRKTEGRVKKVISNKSDPFLDLKLILAQNNINQEFPEKVKRELKHIPEEIYDDELKGRTDYTKLRTYTIDGETAKDYDDAISIKKTGNIYHLYVHIADVSHYVKEDSEIDQEARLRAFSLYLIDKVIPMLDFKISNNMCSLVEGKNRLTMSVYLKIDADGNVIYKDISKSYINVDRRMTYNLVQDIIDEKIKDKDSKDFILMEELALILRKKRKQKGYISFDLPEPEFILNDKGEIVDIKAEEKEFSTEIIEQFMLITNEVIGKFMKDNSIPVIYRVHEQPELEKVLETKFIIEALGYRMDFLNNRKYLEGKKAYKKKLEYRENKNKELNPKRLKREEGHKSSINIDPKEFSEFLDSIEDDYMKEIISSVLLRTMKIAKYSDLDLGHFGISTKNYSHFTAPIRRYTDLFVHRMLKKFLENTLTIHEKNQYLKQSKVIAEGSSMVESKLVSIEREYTDIKSAEFLENKIGEEFEGRISSITNFGIYVKIFNSVEGLVRYVNMDGYVEFDEKTRQAKNNRDKTIYKLGDKIKIRITAVDRKLGNVDFELV